MNDKRNSAERDLTTKRRYPSSTDVARLAGVSQSAVSRAFIEGASVSEQTREKVMKAADELGYGPSMIPRIMLTHQSLLIAVVSGGMYNPFYASVVEKLCQRIRSLGSNVVLFTVEHDDPIDAMIPDILGYRVDGIISALSIVSAAAADRCAKLKIPVVLCNGRINNDWIASVCSDNVSGGREIANLFAREGAQRFAFIGGNKDNMASDDRCAGFLSGLFANGNSDVKIERGNFRYESGFDAALRLFRSGVAPDAVFCANDLMATGAIEAIRSVLKLRVPKDVLVAGFDDIPSSQWPSIQLSTVRQDADALAESALALLQGMISGDSSRSKHHLLKAQLVERQSTSRSGTGWGAD